MSKMLRSTSDYQLANTADREAALREQGYVSEAEFKAGKAEAPAAEPPPVASEEAAPATKAAKPKKPRVKE